MPTITETLRVASVYPFGSAWHWKCGMSATDGPGPTGTCLGGRAHTEVEARAAGEAHIAEEHTRVLYVPVAIEGCRHCGVEQADHGVRRALCARSPCMNGESRPYLSAWRDAGRPDR
jgi:hypothetical protein